MNDAYLGILPAAGPLYTFLADDVLRRALGFDVPRPVFEAHTLHPRQVIVRYTEQHSGAQVACKFYGRKLPHNPNQPPSADYFRLVMTQEFDNLCRLWELGFDRPLYRVARPLATSERAGYALAEEYVAGPKLDAFFKGALERGEEQPLYDRLTDLAAFLAHLHNQTQTTCPADPQAGLAYFDKMLRQLLEKEVISLVQRARLERLRDRWAGSGLLEPAQAVLIHGDATPVNFVFRDGGEVVAIDLERLRRGDALADVGCVAAEIRHAFFLTTGNSYAGESFIQHFYARYAERRSAGHPFETITGRGRFWMGLIELRICRNNWLDLPYRRRLAEEAERCLSW